MTLHAIRTAAVLLLAVAIRGDDTRTERLRLDGDNTLRRSWALDSNLTDSRLQLALLQNTTAVHSTAVYSAVRNSHLDTAVLNATYPESALDDLGQVFAKSSPYHLNRVDESGISGSTLGHLEECNTRQAVNSTILKSQLNSSKVQSSVIIASNINTNCLSCNSNIKASDIRQDTRLLNSHMSRTDAISSQISNSVSDLSKSINSIISNSHIKRSDVFDSKVLDSSLEDSTCDQSTLTNSVVKQSVAMNASLSNSNVLGNSRVQNSKLMNSNVAGRSVAVGSKLTNSGMTNSRIQNCVLVNSHINRRNLNSVVMINNLIISRN